MVVFCDHVMRFVPVLAQTSTTGEQCSHCGAELVGPYGQHPDVAV